MAIEITARKREAQGTGASRRLRNVGKVPGILYGGDQGPVNIELDHKDLFINLRNERFHASILTLDLAGTKQQVLLRAVNMHPFKLQVQHVDFQRVVTCLPDYLPEYIDVDLCNLAVGHSIHARDLALPRGVELALHKSENPVVATVIVPALITEEEEAAAVVAPSEIPTTEQAAPVKEGEAAAEGEKPAAKGTEKTAEKAEKPEKPEKKEKK